MKNVEFTVSHRDKISHWKTQNDPSITHKFIPMPLQWITIAAIIVNIVGIINETYSGGRPSHINSPFLITWNLLERLVTVLCRRNFSDHKELASSIHPINTSVYSIRNTYLIKMRSYLLGSLPSEGRNMVLP